MKSFAEFIAEEDGLPKINLPAINKEVVNRQAKFLQLDFHPLNSHENGPETTIQIKD